jgi:hypothetical protein
MHDYTEGIAASILSMDQDFKREFELLLTELQTQLQNLSTRRQPTAVLTTRGASP